MPVVSAPYEFLNPDVYLDLKPTIGRNLVVKCEGLNFGGSVKMRAAAAMVARAERDNLITGDTRLVESSSGNLGVALSVIAAAKGIPFTCVVDPRCNAATLATMRALGTDLVMVRRPHPVGGFLQARLDRVAELRAADPRYLWLNQYTNVANCTAHYEGTAPEILKRFPALDVLFVGVGTGGTAIGCAWYLRDSGATTRIVAVDAAGSVTLGQAPAPRLIPGLGAAVPPPMFDPDLFSDTVVVPEIDTVRACRTLAANGMLFGGSTGTVVSGALTWLRRHDPRGDLQAVCVSADMGERYLNTIYDDDWVEKNFGAAALEPLPGVRARRRVAHGRAQ
ncbi:2,3-diaminopropionate biosynthesis protein SbnA [Actinoplanes sp. CA-252034]|uniref:2,3-diaminopropionate biosynthesis protein SbnA n=1 Tax=Actinoplanes sp. CA-252034 TaxID=3239906 RepID=UPI003D96F3E2